MGDLPKGMTPWKKGQSGNPAGKPKGTKNRSTLFKDFLESPAIEAFMSKGMENIPVETIADQLVIAAIVKAQGGDVQAIKEVLDSAYGKVTDKIEQKHVFTQMGSVELGDKTDALEFNVGKPAEKPQGEDE